MAPRFLQVNAFTSAPFGGNPAAVVLLEEPRSDGWMQNVARDFNLSETAFLQPRPDAAWSLCWFTPQVEVDLCGHATLAAAHALGEWSLLEGGSVCFHTRSCVLKAHLSDEAITLDFPSTAPAEVALPQGLLQVLGAEPEEVLWCGRSAFDIVLRVSSPEVVARLSPDFAALKRFDTRGVVVTSHGEGFECDFVSRFFGPRVGVDEDPVTGSAHCALAPLWSAILNRNEMLARQISARGGEMRVLVLGERVLLRGQACTVLRGEVVV
jgi:PhzF family phenazine biosynthesis protein